jgi:hypothetical protein
VRSAVTSPIVAFFLSGPLSISLVVFLVWWCLRAQRLSSLGTMCRVNRYFPVRLVVLRWHSWPIGIIRFQFVLVVVDRSVGVPPLTSIDVETHSCCWCRYPPGFLLFLFSCSLSFGIPRTPTVVSFCGAGLHRILLHSYRWSY